MNTSHAVHDTCGDKKLDNEQLNCDGSVDFQSSSPADYHRKVIHKVQTADRGMLIVLVCV